MANQRDELIKLILAVDGQEKIDALKERLEYTKAAIKQLDDAYARGDITLEQYLKDAERLSKEVSTQQKLYDQLTSSVNDQTAAQNNLTNATTKQETAQTKLAGKVAQVGSEGKNAAYKLQQLGGTLDDLQYVGEQGLRPVLNNIMQISPTVGIGLLAFDLLRKGLRSFRSDAESEVRDPIASIKKELSELEKKSFKVPLDYSNIAEAKKALDELERGRAAFNAAQRTQAQGDLSKEITDTVTKFVGGSGQIAKAIADNEVQSGFRHGADADEDLVRAAPIILKAAEQTARNLQGTNKYEAAVANLQHWQEQIDAAAGRNQAALAAFAQKQADLFMAGNENAITGVKNIARANPNAFNNVGEGGVTGREAILAMSGSEKESQHRADVDNELEDNHEKFESSNREWKQIKEKRQAEKDAEEDAVRAGMSRQYYRDHTKNMTVAQKREFIAHYRATARKDKERADAGVAALEQEDRDKASAENTIRDMDMNPSDAKAFRGLTDNAARAKFIDDLRERTQIADLRQAATRADLPLDEFDNDAISGRTAHDKRNWMLNYKDKKADEARAATKANTAAERAAKNILPQYAPDIMGALAQNRQLQAMGMSNSSDQDVLKWLRPQLERSMKSQRQNPQLAPYILDQGYKQFENEFSKGMGLTGNAMGALNAMGSDLADSQAHLMNQMIRVEQRARATSGRVRGQVNQFQNSQSTIPGSFGG